jgi:CTP synthase
VPYIAAAGEMKTKPTQHSVRELTSLGIQPEVLLCRCERPLSAADRAKIAQFCNVRTRRSFPRWTRVRSTPCRCNITAKGSMTRCCAPSASPTRRGRTWPLGRHRRSVGQPEGEVTIGVVGKYVGLPDAYKSLTEALVHGGIANRVKVRINWLDAEIFEDEARVAAALEPLDGILVPGGFGTRGTEGKIAAVTFARHRRVPFFGICLGMQMACVESARASGIENASSTEFGDTAEPVVGLITEWMSPAGLERRQAAGDLGGTMRLGAYPARLSGNSLVAAVYGDTQINERHRHRYEVNVGYREALEGDGLLFTGLSPDGMLPRSSNGRSILGSSACNSTRN